MRHPIDRLISHYIHEWTQRVISVSINDAIDKHPELIDYSRYAMQLEPFMSTYGPSRVLPVFFDRLRSHSQAELERVCQFIGYGGKPAWKEDLAPANVSNQRLRRSKLRETLRDLPGLRPMYHSLVPAALRQRVNGFWQMKRRPALSEDRQKQLTQIFDEDLARLGQWLGIDLNCDNFKQITATQPHDWTDQAVRSSA